LRFALSKALARTISFRMIAVMAIFAGFPAKMSWFQSATPTDR
jgi:hypothetical protein